MRRLLSRGQLLSRRRARLHGDFDRPPREHEPRRAGNDHAQRQDRGEPAHPPPAAEHPAIRLIGDAAKSARQPGSAATFPDVGLLAGLARRIVPVHVAGDATSYPPNAFAIHRFERRAFEVFCERPSQSLTHHRQQRFLARASALQNFRTIGLLLDIPEARLVQIAHRHDDGPATLPAHYDM
jgi:hypothetical protein